MEPEMINIYTVQMCAFLSLVFYILEYFHMTQAIKWESTTGIYSRGYKVHYTSAIRAVWLGRLFLICTIALAIIEQCTFVPDTY
jgi:hypothetical protein